MFDIKKGGAYDASGQHSFDGDQQDCLQDVLVEYLVPISKDTV